MNAPHQKPALRYYIHSLRQAALSPLLEHGGDPDRTTAMARPTLIDRVRDLLVTLIGSGPFAEL